MRVLLSTLLVLLVTTNFCYAKFPKIYSTDSEDVANLKKFHHTWSMDKDIIYNHDMIKTFPFSNTSKDDTSHAKSFYTNGCTTPGYTGQNCEFPICEKHGNPDFSHQVENVMIDFAYYKTCNVSMPIYIDYHMFEFNVEIQTPGSQHPIVFLYDSNGTQIVPNNVDTTDPSRSIFSFDYQLAGTYQLVPLSDLPSDGCYVHVSGVSEMDIHVGFLPYTANDQTPERNDFPEQKVYKNSLNLVVAHPHGLISPGSVKAITLYQQYNIMTRPQLMNLRYGCAYEYYFNGLWCTDTGYYYAKVSGYDFYGFSFTRVVTFKCEINPNPPVTTTKAPPVPVTACQNNGTLINTGTTLSCYCNGLFTGPDCSTPICLNSGVPTVDGNCMCMEGYTGNQCQDVRCKDDTGFNFPKDHPTPIFIIRARSSLSSVVKQINSQLRQLVVDFSDDLIWFQNFGLVIFNNNGTTFDNQYYSSIEDMQAALLNLALTSSNDNSGGCFDTTFSALTQAFNSFVIGNRSPVYVFTDALPSDREYADDVLMLNSFYLAPIYIFQLEPSPDSGCQKYDYMSQEWNALVKITERFSGNIFFVGSNQYGSIGDFIYQHMFNIYYRGDLMYQDDPMECDYLYKYNTIAIDTSFQKIVIVATGDDLLLTLTNPEGIAVTPSITTFINSTTMWSFYGLESGQWQFNILSSAFGKPCSVRVYSGIGPEFHHKIPSRALYWGFTNELTNDAPIRQPIVGLSNSLVLHVDGAKTAERHRLSAEIVIYEKHKEGKILSYAGNGLWRDDCKFEIYFPPFTCYHPDETLYFTVFMRDDNDFMIQRSGAMYCASFHPTQLPPGTCQNGGFMVNGTCVCQPQYTGNYCEKINCFNGGTPKRDFCECIAGFSGQFCEYTTCINSNEENDFNDKDKSMVFLLDISNNNYDVLKRINVYMTTILRDIVSSGRDWIKTFTVIGYDSTGYQVLGIGQRDSLEGISRGFNMAQNISFSAPKSCDPVQFWEALSMAAMISDNYGYIWNFQSTPSNEESYLPPSMASERLQSKQIMLNAFISSNTLNTYSCNGNSNTFLITKEVCEITEGMLYDISSVDFQNIIKIIPTFYSSGVIYQKTMNDCTNGCSVYFPLDAHTQNAQIYVKGTPNGIQTTVTMPNTTQISNLTKLVEDTVTGWEITELRRACPIGYDELGSQYCILRVDTKLSWTDAQSYCQKQGGFIVDDMFPIKTEYLNHINGNNQIWIGLNDRAYVGTYAWDRGVMEPQTLDSTDYTNWAKNISLSDRNKRCVYMSGTWNLDDCSTLKTFICQAHKYVDGYDPKPNEERALVPGKWIVNIKNKGKTTIQIRSQSKIQMFVGYSQYLHDDYPEPNPLSGTSQNMMMVHLRGMADFLRETFLYNTQLYDLYNGVMYSAATFQQRFECTYQWSSQPFVCPNSKSANNAFTALTTGIDEFGYTFQRMKSAHCVNAIESCNHGGIIYDGKCVCNEYWRGKYCDEPICVNNGTLSYDKKTCKCPVGFSGSACEYDNCITKSPDSISSNGKSFVLVLENTNFNIKSIKQLQANLSSILKSVNSSWFSNYVIVLADSTNKPTVQVFNNVHDFQTYLITVTPNDLTTSCSLPLFNAMIKGLQQVNAAQSIVYTVARSLPSDIINESQFATLLSQHQPQLYYHAITSDSGCNISYSDPLAVRIQAYALISSGNLIATSAGTLGNFLASYIPSLYKGNVLTNPSVMSTSCNSSNVHYLLVDSFTTDIFVTMYSNYPSVSIISPSGSIEKLVTAYKDSSSIPNPRLYLYQYPNVQELGIYTLSFQGSGSCYVQVRSSGASELYLGYVPTPSMDNNIGRHLDNTTSTPTGTYNMIVGKVVGEFAKITYAEIYNTYTGEFQYLKFYLREHCTHNLYSDPFKCTEGEMIIKYFGVDMFGFPLVREGYTVCLQNGIPTIEPPGPTQSIPSGGTTPKSIQTLPPSQSSSKSPQLTTKNNSPQSTPIPSTNFKNDKANIFFIIDTSTALPSSSFDSVISTFVASTLIKFSINPNYINVALSGSPGNNNIWLTLPTFNTFTSITMLDTTIINLFHPVDGPQSAGQNGLAAIINEGTNQNFLSTGYSNSQIPHLIFYITTSSTPNQDAVTAAANVRTSKYFQFISISYGGQQSNYNTLKSMSDCTYTPTNFGDLNNLANTISSNIHSAYNNGGIYMC
ncbi:Epidermal growth factor-like domain and C-type lectin domain and von Willebrand factor, type A domain and MD domain and C-type lectin-like domain and C-type lectin fold domain-containing protein [Strongyloides ratti]|uniref:Epidermal growth factor-like domain and C-type lectin domain and von Willebrand factor, type A domain and MD domain and C-type lectin-like domain and C-type lectin fold domain-containing protein n=1 Tax=Strongyloides ratti TaxID=34506 RepID=A0A090MU28_STRRB|nr:Epidermal growth factor-like domain and C-type lectin domain and von Willebrand factor, type A domain and MD domain and C-type lectin-like domain and C-type lectin fold domain-containing protein [Strongyloides ratti]CEF61948.1 Epidermal growth factor-like domain and C-type lectin domain and von Willebrand factor, type A domain and MD domain and C-type lectin-like domain and C-type lectin fold domain-containing protein [Strongyloides ratti]